MLPDSAIVSAASGQVSASLDGEAAILNVNSGRYYGLNEVGSRVWALIQQPRTVAEVREAVLAEYDVEPERWAADLQRLLSELAQHQLIEIRHA